MVTSRVAVGDRARVPAGSLAVRLEGFDETQVARWLLNDPIPEAVARMIVQPTEQTADVPIAFGALPTEQRTQQLPVVERLLRRGIVEDDDAGTGAA